MRLGRRVDVAFYIRRDSARWIDQARSTLRTSATEVIVIQVRATLGHFRRFVGWNRQRRFRGSPRTGQCLIAAWRFALERRAERQAGARNAGSFRRFVGWNRQRRFRRSREPANASSRHSGLPRVKETSVKQGAKTPGHPRRFVGWNRQRRFRRSPRAGQCLTAA